MLQEIFGDVPFSPGFLDAFFVVNIHVQICSVLLGEGDAFIVDQGRVLNGRYPGADGVLDSLWRVRVGFDTQAEVGGFIHSRLQFFQRELLGFGIAAVGEHGAGGEHFDVVGAVVGKLADFLAHFPRAVCLAVMQVPGQLDIGGHTGHRSRAASDRDVGAGHEHAWANDIAASNGIAQGNVVQCAVDSHITHRGKSRFQHVASIGN